MVETFNNFYPPYLARGMDQRRCISLEASFFLPSKNECWRVFPPDPHAKKIFVSRRLSQIPVLPTPVPCKFMQNNTSTSDTVLGCPRRLYSFVLTDCYDCCEYGECRFFRPPSTFEDRCLVVGVSSPTWWHLNLSFGPSYSLV